MDDAADRLLWWYESGQWCLTAAGERSLRLVLRCLAHEHCEVLHYCPWLPMVVAAALHFMPPADAFYVGSALIREPTPLLMSKRASWSMVHAFDRMAKQYLAGPYSELCAHRGVPAGAAVDQSHPQLNVHTSSKKLADLHRPRSQGFAVHSVLLVVGSLQSASESRPGPTPSSAWLTFGTRR